MTFTAAAEFRAGCGRHVYAVKVLRCRRADCIGTEAGCPLDPVTCGTRRAGWWAHARFVQQFGRCPLGIATRQGCTPRETLPPSREMPDMAALRKLLPGAVAPKSRRTYPPPGDYGQQRHAAPIEDVSVRPLGPVTGTVEDPYT